MLPFNGTNLNDLAQANLIKTFPSRVITILLHNYHIVITLF